MAGFLYRLGRWIAAHRWLVLGAWILLVVAFVFAISRVGAETSNNVDLPGTGSQKATDLLADRFPPQQNGQNPIVFHVDSGKLTASDNEKAINQAAKAIQGLPDVVSAPSPFGDQPTGTVSDDEKTAFIPVLLDISSADLDEEEAQAVLDAAEKPAEPLGMEVAAGGSIGSELSTPATESSELVGIIVAMIILTLAFGSIVAMGMPIISAVVGLAVGLTGIGLVGHLFAVPDIGPTLAIMIGLGVGIDYALFLVSRHRAQLAEGEEMRESIALALATSGSAIVFAGGTVVIALVSLAVAGIPLVSSLGLLVGHRRPDRRARGDHAAPGRHVPGRAAHPLPLPAGVPAAKAQGAGNRPLGALGTADHQAPADRDRLLHRPARRPDRAALRARARSGGHRRDADRHPGAAGLRPDRGGIRAGLQRAAPDRHRARHARDHRPQGPAAGGPGQRPPEPARGRAEGGPAAAGRPRGRGGRAAGAAGRAGVRAGEPGGAGGRAGARGRGAAGRAAPRRGRARADRGGDRRHPRAPRGPLPARRGASWSATAPPSPSARRARRASAR